MTRSILIFACLSACTSVSASQDTEVPAISFPDSIVSFGALPKRIAGRNEALIGGDTVLASFVVPWQLRAEGDGPTPMLIDIRVLSRDTTVGRLNYRPVAFTQCPIGLQLFKSSLLTGLAVWQSKVAAGSLSCAATARDSAAVSARWNVPAILGDTLSSGTYFMKISVHLADGRVFEIHADSAYLTSDRHPPSEDLESLKVTATSSVAGKGLRELRARVVVANPGSRRVAISAGCTPEIDLYSDSSRKTSPVWRSLFRRPFVEPPPRFSYVCASSLHSYTIPPHDSTVFSVFYPLREVLGDSLHAGAYRVIAVLRLSNSSSAKTYLVDAGNVYLARVADALPASRLKDGLTYVARARVVRGGAQGADTVRTLLVVKNVSDSRREVNIASDCPVMTAGYRAPLRLDLRESPPVFSGSQKCTGVPRYRFALEPGESWVFGQDTPAGQILNQVGPGRYWIKAWFPDPQVELGAGSVDIR